MSRATRARRIAAAAAYGGGGLGVLGAAGFGLLVAEAKLARRWIGRPFDQQALTPARWFHPEPVESGTESGTGRGAERATDIQDGAQPLHLAMLGDSSAAGLGATDPGHLPGAVIAAGLAAITGRPVRLHQVAVVGAESSALAEQVDRLVAGVSTLDAAVVMVGANDVTHRIPPAVAVQALGATVQRLREVGAEVVVGTCPDLGTIKPIAPPLRTLARRLSRQLAAAQTIAVVEAGGRTVSLGDLLGPEFAASPRELFSSDRFHPSDAGYARAAAVLLPSVAVALGVWPSEQPEWPSADRVAVDDVAHAAARASRTAGTEVVGTEVDGASRGPGGRWAIASLRRGAWVLANTVGSTVATTAETVLGGARAILPSSNGGSIAPHDQGSADS